MSAEQVIQSYLSGRNPSCELLESYLLSESISIDAFSLLVKSITSVRNLLQLENVFSRNKNTVQLTIRKTAAMIDSDIFDDPISKKINPVNDPVPKTQKQGESWLKKFFVYISTKMKGLQWPSIKHIYQKSYALAVKSLIAAGIVGAAATLGVIAFPLAVILAIIITIMSVMDAVRNTAHLDENERIDLDSSWNNVAAGFKKMITTLKLQKGESKLAIIGALLVGFMAWVKYMSNIDVMLGDAAQWAATKGKELVGAIREPLTDFVFGDEKGLKRAQGLKDTVAGVGRVAVGDDAADNISDKVRNVVTVQGMRSAAERLGWHLKVWIIPLICVLSIVYLFSNLVDEFNIRKIREAEREEKEEYEEAL